MLIDFVLESVISGTVTLMSSPDSIWAMPKVLLWPHPATWEWGC